MRQKRIAAHSERGLLLVVLFGLFLYVAERGEDRFLVYRLEERVGVPVPDVGRKVFVVYNRDLFF